MNLDLYKLISEKDLSIQISKINQELLSTIKGPKKLNDLVREYLSPKSKRLRPALMIAVITLKKDHLSIQDIRAITSVEILHLSSLIHDDIIDHSMLRHNLPTINSKNGDGAAILAGDYLINKSFQLALKSSPKTLAYLGQAFEELCEGQYLELKDNFNKNRSIPDYIQSIKGKTASLFGYSLMIAANQANFNQEEIQQFYKFGINFGIAFQIIDDLVDLYSTALRAGKKTQQDLIEGKYNLPILIAAKLKVIKLTEFEKNLDPKLIQSRLEKSDVFQLTFLEIKKYLARSQATIKYPLVDFPEKYLKWSFKQYFDITLP